MPAYNAAQTLRKTFDEVMEQEIVDLVIVVDDGSQDETVAIAGRHDGSAHAYSRGSRVHGQGDRDVRLVGCAWGTNFLWRTMPALPGLSSG